MVSRIKSIEVKKLGKTVDGFVKKMGKYIGKMSKSQFNEFVRMFKNYLDCKEKFDIIILNFQQFISIVGDDSFFDILSDIKKFYDNLNNTSDKASFFIWFFDRLNNRYIIYRLKNLISSFIWNLFKK